MIRMNDTKMTAKRLVQYFRYQPIATWRGELIGVVAAAVTCVLLILFQRMVSLSAEWYWTVLAAGTVTMLALVTIAQRRWDKPKATKKAHEESAVDMLAE